MNRHRPEGARFASAISEHPVAAQAVGELAGQVLDQLDGSRADLVVAFVSPHFAGAVDDVAGVLRAVLHPRALVGGTFAAVVGVGREVEDSPAISLWAASSDALTTRVIHLDVVADGESTALVGWPDAHEPAVAGAHTLLLLGDPFSFPTDAVLQVVGSARPDLQVIGGMASAATGPGGNHLIADEQVVTRGAVGVLLGGEPIHAAVSQGCRPVGQPFVVTAVDGSYVQELGGRPALERLQELALTLDDDEREQLREGLHVGLVVDEHRADFGRGDFLVRNVIGLRPEDGALAVGAAVEVGQTLQFHVRDHVTADEDLRHLLAPRTADAALLFTCTGRGARLFGTPDHDARVIGDAFGPIPLAGAFCAGELGPVAGRNHVHGFTASVALFGEK